MYVALYLDYPRRRMSVPVHRVLGGLGSRQMVIAVTQLCQTDLKIMNIIKTPKPSLWLFTSQMKLRYSHVKCKQLLLYIDTRGFGKYILNNIGKTEPWEVYKINGLKVQGTDYEINMHSDWWCRLNSCPISGYRLHPVHVYSSQQDKGFNELPEIPLYGCLAQCFFLTPHSVAKGGSITIWSVRKSPVLRSPNWLTG